MFLEDPSPRIPGRTAPEKIRRFLLHPGSGSLGKNWAVSNWREIATEVKRVFPEWSWVLVTGEAEAERGQTEEILNSWPAPPEEHWEGLPLTELATRMMESEAVFLGHDSGISHLAAATGLPCFLLFGPSDPTVWAPPQPHVRVLKRMQGSLADLPVPPVWKELGAWLERVSKNPSGACDGTATC
jgi:ADP-heptose:LPS heptosyltransferase